MFTIILFLVLALIMPAFVPSQLEYGIFESPWISFFAGLTLWFLTLIVLWLQKKLLTRTPKKTLGFVMNCEVILSLAISLFYLGYLKPFDAISPALALAITLVTYLTSVAWIEYLFGGRDAAKRIVMLLLPASIPAVVLGVIAESVDAEESEWQNVLTALLFLLALLMITLVPYLLQKSWRCHPLPDGEKKDRLEALCKKLKFNCNSLNVWPLMSHSYTAAIVGVVPKYCYVMFTEKLFYQFPIESTEAVLAHEIGHSKRRHLLYYPLIAIAMMYFAFAAAGFISSYLYYVFKWLNQLYPNFYWKETDFLTLYLMIAIFLGLGLKYFFGFYSRLFERQADLYIFEAGIEANHMTYALDEIGKRTGNTHDVPNWHHYSLRERIDFLNAAKNDPSLIAAHHREVRFYMRLLFVVLISVILLEFYFS